MEIINGIGVSNLITILVALVGVLGGIYVFRLTAFWSASAELINTFTPSIARIDAAILHVGTHDSPDVNTFLSDNFEIHAAAVEKFSFHVVGKRKRKAYEKAWKEYCDLEPYHGGVTLFAGHYAPPDGNHLEFIKGKIENILKFAKHK